MTTTDMELLLKRYVGILSEDFQNKLDIIIEGKQFIAEKLDRTTADLKSDINRIDQRLLALEIRFGSQEVKLDSLATDLSEHRADTEALHGLYRVKEQ